MALWPVIIFKNSGYSEDEIILNHEKIHHRQQLEMLIIPYYIWYFIEYWSSMLTNGFCHHKAYMSISFEKEAYANQRNLNYLENRSFLASVKYLKKHGNQENKNT